MISSEGSPVVVDQILEKKNYCICQHKMLGNRNPSNQSNISDEEQTGNNTSIKDNMELLEVALKRSIDWSMRKRRPSAQPVAEDDLGKVEEMNSKLSDESHMRAFVTHFKIELNDLMGSKSCKDETSSFSDGRESIDTENADLTMSESRFNNKQSVFLKMPMIKINGKHSGQYDLNGESDDEPDLPAPDRRHVKVDRCSEKRTVRSSRRRSSLKSVGGNRSITSNKANNEDETDGGYGSLGRGGFRSDLVQQLNDIKSRLIDMVHEIDDNLKSCLTSDELEAFNRRRDALIVKLDVLIDSSSQKANGLPRMLVNVGTEPATPPDSVPSSLSSTNTESVQYEPSSGQHLLIRNKSELNLHSDGYEEQVQVIDYNLRRRASDNSALRAGFSTTLINQPLVVNSSMTSLNFSSGFDRKQPIDFGAMMRDYENNQNSKTSGDLNKHEGIPTGTIAKPVQQVSNNNQHIPSSSSTSTYSASSHTSSSSFL